MGLIGFKAVLGSCIFEHIVSFCQEGVREGSNEDGFCFIVVIVEDLGCYAMNIEDEGFCVGLKVFQGKVDIFFAVYNGNMGIFMLCACFFVPLREDFRVQEVSFGWFLDSRTVDSSR